jgi:hypothetical protein
MIIVQDLIVLPLSLSFHSSHSTAIERTGAGFGLFADIETWQIDVRFTLNSDEKSGHRSESAKRLRIVRSRADHGYCRSLHSREVPAKLA